MNTKPWEKLPANVQDLKGKVEAALGQVVTIQSSDDENGAMTFEWIGETEPVVFCKDYSDGGLAEELHHMLLDLDGFLRPNTDGSKYLKEALTILYNALQHQVIFPKLKAMGFSQDEVECGAARNWLSRLIADRSDDGGSPSDDARRTVLAMLYVRAKLHCSEKEFNKFVSDISQRPDFKTIQEQANNVLDKIDLDENSTASHYNEILRLCLNELGLEEVELVDPREGS